MNTFTTVFVTELSKMLVDKGVLTQDEMEVILDRTGSTCAEMQKVSDAIDEKGRVVCT